MDKREQEENDLQFAQQLQQDEVRGRAAVGEVCACDDEHENEIFKKQMLDACGIALNQSADGTPLVEESRAAGVLTIEIHEEMTGSSNALQAGGRRRRDECKNSGVRWPVWPCWPCLAMIVGPVWPCFHPSHRLIAVRKVARLAVGILRGLDITIEPASICIAFASFRQAAEFPDCMQVKSRQVCPASSVFHPPPIDIRLITTGCRDLYRYHARSWSRLVCFIPTCRAQPRTPGPRRSPSHRR